MSISYFNLPSHHILYPEVCALTWKICTFLDDKNLGKACVISKFWYQVIQNKKQISSRLDNIFEKVTLNPKGVSILNQWNKLFSEQKQQEYDKAIAIAPEQVEEQVKKAKGVLQASQRPAEELIKQIPPNNVASSEYFLEGAFASDLIQSVFNMFESGNANDFFSFNQDKKDPAWTIAKNIVSDQMNAMLEPENLGKFLENFGSLTQEIDEDTPFGDIAKKYSQPWIEISSPIIEKHLNVKISNEEIFKFFEEELNATYGSLNDYLAEIEETEETRQNKILEEALKELAIEDAGELALQKTTQSQTALSSYQFDKDKPRNDYEKGIGLVLSKFSESGLEMDSTIGRDIQPVVSKFLGILYQSAGCQTPEEFQERMEKLAILKNKASEKIGQAELLKREREKVRVLIAAHPNFHPNQLKKVDDLFEQIEKNPEILTEFDALYLKAVNHQLQFVLNGENLKKVSKDIDCDELDPFYSVKVMDHYSKVMINEMQIYWKGLVNENSPPLLKLQHEVTGLQLEAVIPSLLRCQLHRKYREVLRQPQTSLLKGTKQSKTISANPIKLSEFDRNIRKQFFPNVFNVEEVELLRTLPYEEEDSIVAAIIQKESDKHQKFISTFNQSEVKIEEVNDQ